VIIFDISGGLGNQFFQYAFGRYLALKNNTTLKINVASFVKDKQRTFKLDCFKTEYETMPLDEILEYLDSYLRLTPLFRKWYRLYWPISFRRYFENKGLEGYNPKLKNARQGYFYGYWSNEDYFKDIRDQLQKEFMLREHLVSPALKKAKQMTMKENAVAVHVRRGDYVHHPVYSKIFNQLSPAYYNDAIKLLKERVKDPVFYVFTDDVKWCQANFGSAFPGIKFADEFQLENDYEEFELMKNFSHFINANSTFSWWAAWLAKNDGKVVVAPKKWFVEDRKKTADMVPESWILI